MEQQTVYIDGEPFDIHFEYEAGRWVWEFYDPPKLEIKKCYGSLAIIREYGIKEFKELIEDKLILE